MGKSHYKHPKPVKPKVRKKMPKVSKKRNAGKQDNYQEQMRDVGKQMLEMISHKDEIEKSIKQTIEEIINIFKQYDCVQLLGGIGLILFDNIPNIEKEYYATISGTKPNYDEDAEVVAEYAMNFALAIPNENTEDPTIEIISSLYDKLKQLKTIYTLIDMPTSDDAEEWLTWMTHSILISIRGDGYQDHMEEVFQELFKPHTQYFEDKFGFSFNILFKFCTQIEKLLYSKVASHESIYDATVAHERWTEWMDSKYGTGEDAIDKMIADALDPTNPIMGAFIKANPDVACPTNPHLSVLYAPSDYSASDKIFWVVPQNEEERNLLDTLSTTWGDNARFIEGDYKGNIMNGRSILAKPIIKIGDKYYCFTPMLLYRNMFTIAESLIKRDGSYYQQHYQNNVLPESRDLYIERKVRSELERFLPNVQFHSSVTYTVNEDGQLKNAELDILGVSDKATYLIEVKAHELSHADRVGVNGLKDKFKDSVTSACRQSQRALKHIQEDGNPNFYDHGVEVAINKTKPIYKIAITFQHYSI